MAEKPSKEPKFKLAFRDGILIKIINPDLVREKANVLWEADRKEGCVEKHQDTYWFQAEEIFKNSGFMVVSDKEWELYKDQFVCSNCGRIVYYKDDQADIIVDLYHETFPHHRRVPPLIVPLGK